MSFTAEAVLEQLSNKEKTALLSGIDFWHTYPIPDHNVPSIRVSDGPNGIRGTKFFAGIPATCLPCATGLASTWDKSLLHRAGKLLGDECIAKGAHVWLGPTINMQRSPLGGRGFESFSEDPHLSGILAARMIKGCEETGVQACVKHFVGNDQEHERRAVDTIITPRAFREVYLRPFQIVARDARPGAMMTSYNKVNGRHVCEDETLLEDLVRKEWGWDPLVISDWYGTYSTAQALIAGLDLEMPGVTRYRGTFVEFALSARIIKQSTLDSRALRVLRFVERASTLKVAKIEGGNDTPDARALNREIAASSVVLLKNERSILPIDKTKLKGKKIALIGSHVKSPAISGGGSASLEPYYTVSLYDAIVAKLAGTGAEITYEVGAYAHKMLPVIDRLFSNGKIHFYNEPVDVKDRKRLGTEPLHKTYFQLMDYNGSPGLNKALFYATVEGDFTPDEGGLWDFGLTVFGTANLYIDGELVIENTTIQRKGTAFFGKGTDEEIKGVQLIKGKTYKLRIEFGSSNTSRIKDVGVVSFGGGACQLGAVLRIDEKVLRERAVKVSQEADCVVVCTGLNAEWESEGFDRPHMDLPPAITALITSILAASPQAIIVNQSGTPVSMPWASSASTLLQAWYGGNETGNGIADVLFGSVNPAAKLPLSWPVDVRHNPTYLNWGATKGRVLYGEDVYVGYKYYDKIGREVLFPFGHGLSYTSFALSDLTIAGAVAELDVRNAGKRAGAEVLQLYVAAPQSGTQRPLKELHGFEKVYLQPGEKKRVKITIDKYAGSFWDEIESKFCVEKGVYEVLVGTSSADIRLKAEWKVAEDKYWLGL